MIAAHVNKPKTTFCACTNTLLVITGIPAHVTSLHTLLYKYPKAGNSFTVIN